MKQKFLALLLSLTAPLLATSLDIYCDDQGCVDFSIEYLYLKPCVNDPFFAVPEQGANDPFGTRFANELEYTSGVRAALGYNLSACDRLAAFLEGSYISDTSRRTVDFGTTNPRGLGTKGYPGVNNNNVEVASSKIDYDFWNLKGGFRYCFCTPCPFLLAANLNFHYVSLDYKEEIFYELQGADSHRIVSNGRDTWAAGPEIGLDFGYRMTNCFTLVTRGSYGLLVASHQARFALDAATTPQDASTTNSEVCTIVPSMELKIGLNYMTRFCNCMDVAFEIGFDVLRYTDLIDQVRWIGDNSTAGYSLDYYSPFTLHGLYLSMNIGF